MWNSVQTNRLVYHVMNQTNFQPLTENSDMSEDGSQYFAYKSASTFHPFPGFFLESELDTLDPRRFTHMADRIRENPHRFYHRRQLDKHY